MVGGGFFEFVWAISTGSLNALPHVYVRPIDVLVWHGPYGET